MESIGKCAMCNISNKVCREDGGQGPAYCSTLLYPDPLKRAAAEYSKPDVREFARQSSIQEAECYIDRDTEPHYRFPVKPRVQELIEFARKMGYRKLGMAFCAGLQQEASLLNKILEDHGFEVVSVVCKVGGVDKGALGLEAYQRVKIGKFETMCNPIAQAEVLNAAGTDLNVMMGLCVGHDSLFIKYSNSMVTVFAVKDRVLANNPMGAIYNYNSYYERFKEDRRNELTVKGK